MKDYNNSKNTNLSLGIKKIGRAFIIIFVLVIYIIGTHNRLVVLLNKVKERWSATEILLKKRYDLIPNLVKTVKGYASHEKDTLKEVVEARNQTEKVTNKEEKMNANGQLSKANR